MPDLHCPYCDTQLDPGGQFCHACGAPLEASPEQKASPEKKSQPVPETTPAMAVGPNLDKAALEKSESLYPAQSPNYSPTTTKKKIPILVWIAAAAAVMCSFCVLCIAVGASLVIPVVRDQIGQAIPIEDPILSLTTPTLQHPNPIGPATQTPSSLIDEPGVVAIEGSPPTPFTNPTPRPQGRPFVGELAPEFTLLDANTGEAVTLSQFTGQPVVILFWATWCGYCEEEMPILQAAHEAYQTDGLVILGVDYQDRRADVVDYGRDHQLTFPLLLDKDGEITDDAYQVNGLPTSVFMFRDGTISFIQIGTMTNNELHQKLESIIAP